MIISPFEPKDVTINSNDVYIECKADGEPKPSIKWISSEGLELVFHSFSFY